MRLVLSDNQVVRLVKMSSFTTKTGKLMHFVSVANTTTFESEDFVLDTDNCSPAALGVGGDYSLIVDVGKYTNCILLPLPPKK